MNQILSMGSNLNDNNNYNKKKRNNSYKEYNDKANINSILKFFAILIILFGLTLIGSSTYGIINSTPKQKDNINVTTENIGIEATIKVSAGKPIKSLKYKWGQGEEKIIQGNGTIQLETTVEIPDGNNILNIVVIDYYGNETQYQKQYINERNDKTKPTIDIPTVKGNMLNIVAKDDNEIAYITYKWNSEQETRIDMDIAQTDKKQLQTIKSCDIYW